MVKSIETTKVEEKPYGAIRNIYNKELSSIFGNNRVLKFGSKMFEQLEFGVYEFFVDRHSYFRSNTMGFREMGLQGL